ncbi:RT0821/Lpp0805 family surface protein [Kumtagia ephedrae]|jgi:hypothetical protein|uniref:Surface antigen domain-containing protein n=1 Tax=Kumtagia ephedrae TaxID=2116701 RepID=A0A2P7SJ91_9HYPH|nr:RT0821/Lpp0805 family surface protein [Mesorhizobium ephedrae]PSJ62540.1 hypothetical protein C7I84_07995 [Mesorhizobium ephedrae]
MAVVLLAAAGLSGCAAGIGLDTVEADRTIVTGNVGNAVAIPDDPDQLSDEATIRNAVSAADVELLKGAPIPWANAETGSRGAISGLVEEKIAEMPCRRFTTSRERFDGIALYRGEVCMVAPGAWQVKDFAAL